MVTNALVSLFDSLIRMPLKWGMQILMGVMCAIRTSVRYITLFHQFSNIYSHLTMPKNLPTFHSELFPTCVEMIAKKFSCILLMSGKVNLYVEQLFGSRIICRSVWPGWQGRCNAKARILPDALAGISTYLFLHSKIFLQLHIMSQMGQSVKRVLQGVQVTT